MTIMRLAAAAALIACTSTIAFAAEPVGVYQVQGTNPGNTDTRYSGVVSVEKTGDAYQVIWIVGNQKYEGTGLGNEQFLAVSYQSDDQSGLALYRAEGDGWVGIWTSTGGTTVGTERWERK
jgi:hypothetical protein